MTEPGVVPRRTVPARSLRHGSRVIDLHERLTVVTGLDARAVDELVAAIAAGQVELVGVASGDETAQSGAPSLVFRLPPPVGALADPANGGGLDAEVAQAEAALADAKAAVAKAEAEYTSAQDALLVIRRDADREAPAALAAAEQHLDEAQARASEARRALDAARQTGTGSENAAVGTGTAAGGAEPAPAELKNLQARRERMQASRDEIAERLLRLPPALDVGKVEQALAGLRRLRQVKPRPMARAVEIADRVQEIDTELAQMGLESPPEWLVKPALDALRSARAELEALETGKPTVSVDPAQVQTVEAAHARLLEAEAKVMEKGSRANRRRLDEASAAEREALHTLGLSSYDQFLKYLAPTLDASAREERLTDARARVDDAATVWAELHGGSVPDAWTSLHLERAALAGEAAEILGEDIDDADLDERLRNHLEAVVDTSWAEDALAAALAETKVPLSPGGLEAAAEQLLAEAPAAREEREQAEADLREIDAELASIQEQLAELSPAAALAPAEGSENSAAAQGAEGDTSGGDGPAPSGLAELEEAATKAGAAVADAEAAVATARKRVAAAEGARSTEAEAATRAEAAKSAVAAANEHLANAERGLQAAHRAAEDAKDASASAVRSAEAAAQGAALEMRLTLVGRAVVHREAGVPLVVAGSIRALGDTAAAADLLSELSESVQLVALDADGSLAGEVGRLGDAASVASA